MMEAFEPRRFHKGKINYSTSTVKDSHIEHVVGLISKTKLSDAFVKEITQHIVLSRAVNQQPISPQVENILKGVHDTHKISKKDLLVILDEMMDISSDFSKKAPILSETTDLNKVESEIFSLFSKTAIDVPTSSTFNVVTFYKLVRAIQADHNEFWPLRGFIDRRSLYNPTFYFTADAKTPEQYKGVETAACLPHGSFVFNNHFMQKLIDWSHLKGLKPKGRKYVANGGDIPDDYAYLEFVIMHEFLHYTDEFFYYHKIIPRPEKVNKNLHMQICNYVHDFCINYLLVKSGYPQLPMGLFNDSINYDRQKRFVEMYHIVADELLKLKQDQQDALQQMLGGMSDEHEAGNEEAEEMDISDKGITADDIDEEAKKLQGQMEAADDADEEKRKEAEKQRKQKMEELQRGKPGRGGEGDYAVDYSKIIPTFNWRTLIQRFIKTASSRTEETYARPSRRGITGLEITRQMGAAAIKPAEKPLQYSDNKLAFVFDSSGSMSSIIGKIYANAIKLLRQPEFRSTESAVYKFSENYTIYKGNFATNKAGVVDDVKKHPKIYDMKMYDVFAKHIGGGTNFSSAMADDIVKAVKVKYNVIFFLDSDDLYGSNMTNLMTCIKANPKNCFIIFDSRDTWLDFRQKSGIASPNFTYFNERE